MGNARDAVTKEETMKKCKGTEIRNGHGSKVAKAVRGKGAKLTKGKKLKK